MNDWLLKYLTSNYIEAGRELPDIDCWGLVRLARAEMGWPLLPSFGRASCYKPKIITAYYRLQSAGMAQCAAERGAIAAVFRGKVCTHVGLVVDIDGRLGVLETNPKTGCRWLRLKDFEKSHPRVVYYRDSNLPEQA